MCAENRVFEITGTEKLFAGFYVENKYPAIRFQKIGGKDAYGNFHFLFTTFHSVPPKDGWKSKSGKIKHFKVNQRSSLVYSLEQTESYI